MSVTWTNELTETLIDLYHNQIVLWDSSDVHYKNKNKKKDAWKSISDIMGLHELEIQRKIKNLTAQFFREKKKLKEDNKSGSSTSETPRWFAYQRLLFLTDRNEPRLCAERGLNESHDSGLEKSAGEECSHNQSPLRNEVNANDITLSETQPGYLSLSDIRRSIKGSKRKISNYDQQQEGPCDILKELQTKKSRNRFAIFGEHVAAKIEALKSSYAQNVVEHLISNILFEASIGKYDYPAPRQMSPFSTHSSNSSFSLIHTHAAPSPQYASPPSPQLEYPTQTTQQIQSTPLAVLQIEHEPLTPKCPAAISPKVEYV
ncbi:uncharacterized protein LOC124533925 [Vanessa cardui]|uniref:uncharacterized protein LOC124533925 n=1 Tax=Vanessa cardui TaxID=171605 RepID=UPI001F144BE8|nr:uncharacterized protein LOC124533925 [Vanessa cardui]